MSQFIVNEEHSESLADKVIVLTGGSSGVGASTVELLIEKGAKVAFGDVQVEAAEALVQKLGTEKAVFLKTDVTVYGDILTLFDTAFKKWGRIDSAISVAGVMEMGNFVDPELSLEDINKAPTTLTMDVNLKGPLFFTRIAAVYLQQGRKDGVDKSITLVSSVAGLMETPGMPAYMASKHGVVGMVRGLRLTLPASGIRINAVCPWFVSTIMTQVIDEPWTQHGLPKNSTRGLGLILADITAEKGMNGKVFFVEGDRAWDVEEGLAASQPQWMGETQSKEFNRGQALLKSIAFMRMPV